MSHMYWGLGLRGLLLLLLSAGLREDFFTFSFSLSLFLSPHDEISVASNIFYILLLFAAARVSALGRGGRGK